jgi:hypothetical protein
VDEVWRPVEVILPDQLSAREVQAHLESQIRINASEAGEFVALIRLGLGQPHDQGLRKWSASYLPGPPAAFPTTPWAPGHSGSLRELRRPAADRSDGDACASGAGVGLS